MRTIAANGFLYARCDDLSQWSEATFDEPSRRPGFGVTRLRPPNQPATNPLTSPVLDLNSPQLGAVGAPPPGPLQLTLGQRASQQSAQALK